MTIRYRKLDENGDYTFGKTIETQEFWVDQKEAVAQAILTRLRLATNEWFLDQTAGTPYATNILGFVPPNVRDFSIRARILDTPGVTSITSYTSTVSADRTASVSASVDTIYGAVSVNSAI